MTLEQILAPALPRVWGRGQGGGGSPPAPTGTLASDSFNRADGAPGVTEVGGLTWNGTMLIASNALVPNPTYGDELITDPGMEIWTSPTDLTHWTETPAGASTVNREATIKHGGSYSARADIVSGAGMQIQFVSASSLKIYRVSYWLYEVGSGSGQLFVATSGPVRSPGEVWTQYIETKRGSGGNLILNRGTTSGDYTLYWDDASLKEVTASDYLALVDCAQSDVSVSAVLLGAASDAKMRGVAARWNAARTDGLIAMYTGAGTQQITLHKIIAGVWTSLIAVTQAFVAGAALQIVTSGASVSVYYNGAQIGTTQTVSDASILANTHHGVFVTDPAAPVDTFLLTAP